MRVVSNDKLKIYSEESYRLFRFIKGNRPLVDNSVRGIVNSYEGGLDLFPYCPILVNDSFYVIDGQHRLAACKRLKLPVYFIIVPEVSLVQIATLNSNTTRWKTSDFFNCFIENGNKDYAVLEQFKITYNLGINDAVCLLMQGNVNHTKKEGEIFKKGQFKLKAKTQAVNLMSRVIEYEDICAGRVVSSGEFIRAISLLLETKDYDHKNIIERMKDRKVVIEKREKDTDYITFIKQYYN